MRFFVINAQTGIGVDAEGYPAQYFIRFYETGAEAALVARTLSENTGVKHQVRQELAGVDWKARERARFESGGHVAPAWLAGSGLNIPPDHFLHVAKKDPSKLAYTESEEKGARDIQTVIRVGAYISRFFPELSTERVQALVHAHASEYGEAEHEIFFERDPEKIIAIYQEGHLLRERNSNGDEIAPLASCMSYGAEHYSSSEHPLSVYGGSSDLSLAYVRDKATGDLIARAIVWESEKKFYRTYGSNRLTIEGFRALLISQGFTRTNLLGARLNRIFDPEEREYVLPYLDGSQYVRASTGGQFFVICDESEAEYICHNQNGFADPYEQENQEACEHCEEYFSESELHSVYVSARRSEAWCYSCRSEDAFICEGTSQRVDLSESVEIDGQLYSSWWASENANYCEQTGEHTFEDVTPVTVLYRNYYSKPELGSKNYSASALARALADQEVFICRISGAFIDQKLAIFDEWSSEARDIRLMPEDAPEGFSGSIIVRSYSGGSDFTFNISRAA